MATSNEMAIEPVGFVHHGHDDTTVKEQWATLEARIEVDEKFAEGLDLIDEFSHLMVLYWMHRLREGGREILQIKPRGLLKYGLTLEELPLVGVFASDAPVRPNPIGLTVVQLLGRERNVLTVRGLDAFEGAPVIDIKPYTEDRLVPDARTAGWHQELLRKTGAKRV
ncbi:MAG TPA: tRNA (N6-threonylcarbamoyladenosine(37)-N6)-methyltransferase TrmO [Actinomycetota bacterium]|nr:tRNA (N6-threonylcarbamoyladenosine(37)-N6)-methyltransferase TrmO [Actinomycetota bacterium]